MSNQFPLTVDRVAVPAWFDPKRRTVVFDPTTILCGVFAVSRTTATFITTRRVEFEIPLSEVTSVRWLKFGQACDLTTTTSTHRVFVSPPVDGAPHLNRDAFLEIAEILSDAGDLGDLVEFADFAVDLGSLADVLGIVGALGDSMQGISALRRAKRSREALQRHFGQIT